MFLNASLMFHLRMQQPGTDNFVERNVLSSGVPGLDIVVDGGVGRIVYASIGFQHQAE